MQADIPLRGMKQWVRANQFLPRSLVPLGPSRWV